MIVIRSECRESSLYKSIWYPELGARITFFERKMPELRFTETVKRSRYR